MTAAARPLDESMRTLRRKIANAEEGQLRRVVETVDALASRGHIDQLIEPLRPRLDTLRVTHPLRFPRLLFLPLDPLIVSSKRWQFGQNTLPRTMILPMTRLVEEAFGSRTAGIKKTIQSRTTADTEVVLGTGATLWPDAAAMLASAAAPARWHETGMSDRVFDALAKQVAALLRQAPALDRMVHDTANGLMPPDRRQIEDIVRTLTRERADALPMLAVLLVSRLPQAAGTLYDLAATRALLGLKAATDQAADLLLKRLETGEMLAAYRGLSAFSAAMSGLATLLCELDHEYAPRERREQIRALRQRLDSDCQIHFRDGMTDEFLMPLQACKGGEAEPDIARLEEAARGLRMLEAEAKRIGPAIAYQEMVAEAVGAVQDLPEHSALGLISRVRLLELLAGSDAALALLERGNRSVSAAR